MHIEEMHVTFRELAQQMGMQTVRAILTEDIDICLRAAIIEKARTVITETVGPLPYNDKIARQNAVISPINALRTLYRKGTINATKIIVDDNGQPILDENGKPTYEDTGLITGSGTEVDPFRITISNEGVMLYTGFKVSYNGNTIYDCRIIEAEDVGQTLRDFCSRAAKDAPIITVFGNEESIDCDIYVGRKEITKPQLIQYLYIAEPAKVCYDEDDESKRVDCDLPPYLHMEIVQRAVTIYLTSIGAVRSNNNNND